MKKFKSIFQLFTQLRNFLIFLFIFTNVLVVGQFQNNHNIDSLIKVSNSENGELKPREYYYITIYYYSADSLFVTMDYAQRGIEVAIKQNDFKTLGELYIIKGYVHLTYGTYVKSIDFFTKGELIGKEHNHDQLIIGANHGMGRVYNELKEYEKSIAAIKKGLKLAQNSSDSRNIAILYNAMGNSLQSLGNLDSAMVYFDLFLSKSKEIDDSLSMVYAYVNIGEIHRMHENYDVAKEHYFKAQKLNININDAQAKAAIYGNLSNIYSAQEDYVNTILYLKKSIELCKNNNGLSNYLLEDYKSIVDAYASIDQYDSAYTFYNEYIAFRDSVFESDRLQTIDNLLTEYEIAENEAQSKILAQKLRTRTMILIFSFSLIILIVLLLILTYSRYQLKTRIYKEETEALNLTIDEKNRELVTRVMEQNRQTEVYEGISKTISSLENNEEPDVLKDYLTNLKISLSKKEKIGMGWDSFKLHFEQVHPDFFNKLIGKSDILTQNDLRICGYIKLHLSTKDIANILNISDRAIQTSRYRIKKKLGLDKEIDLMKYIQNL